NNSLSITLSRKNFLQSSTKSIISVAAERTLDLGEIFSTWVVDFAMVGRAASGRLVATSAR
ncbi:MAG: hypothetical protein ACRCVA_09480, partial [Phreatobacter sp.]